MQHHRWFLLFQEETGSPLAAESSLFVTPCFGFLPSFVRQEIIAWESHSTPVCWGCQ